MVEADGIIIGSPTYYANCTANTQALMERAGYATRKSGNPLARKVGAAVVAVRRGGAIHAFDSINHWFQINEMILIGSSYWNIGIGLDNGDVENDDEGHGDHGRPSAGTWPGRSRSSTPDRLSRSGRTRGASPRAFAGTISGERCEVRDSRKAGRMKVVAFDGSKEPRGPVGVRLSQPGRAAPGGRRRGRAGASREGPRHGLHRCAGSAATGPRTSAARARPRTACGAACARSRPPTPSSSARPSTARTAAPRRRSS